MHDRHGGAELREALETALCRRLAGEGPAFVAPAGFAHGANWKDALAAWQRTAAPNARIIFDVFSLDHRRAAGSMAAADAAFAVGSTELCAACDELGLRIIDAVPYGAVLGPAGANAWLAESFAFDRTWDRVLSWSTVYAQLHALLVLLDGTLLAALGTAASGRLMVALENVPGGTATAAWSARNREKSASLASGLDAPRLAACGLDVDALRVGLQRALMFPPNRIVLFRLLAATIERNWAVTLNDFLEAPETAAVTELLAKDRLDRSVGAALAAFAADAAPLLAYRGIDLATAFKYELTEAILDEGLGLFAVPGEPPP